MPKQNLPAKDLKYLDSKTFEITNAKLEKLLNQTYFLLGRLDGILANISNPELLLEPVVIAEAVKSSNIESIGSTILEQLEINLKGRKALTVEQKLTSNYKDALLAGFEYLQNNQKFDLELILLIQKILLPQQSGIRHNQPVVIANNATGQILHKPPVGKEKILDYLDNWLDFAANYNQIDVLVKVGVLHAQFESIHPFVDGNGRIGRILIILFLVYKRVLDYPGLFISDYILTTRTYYYLALQAAQKDDDFSTIVEYLAQAIYQKTQFNLNLIEQIQSLQTYFDKQIQSLLPEIYSPKLIQYLFLNPFYSILSIQKYLQISRNTASKYLHLMVEKDLIKAKIGRKNKLFYNDLFLKEFI